MKKLILTVTFLSTTFLIGCGPIDSIMNLANSRKIQICTGGHSTNCNVNDRITLDKVTLVSHTVDGLPGINPTNQINTAGGVVFSVTINGVVKYFGAASSDWAAAWDSIKNLNAAQKDHAITQFFQGQFDSIGFLTPSYFTIDDPNSNDPAVVINMVKYEFVNDPGHFFSESSDSVKDVEAMGAHIEASRYENLADTLGNIYGLSEERAQVVAKNISAYQRLSSKRSLTEKEKNFFSSELLGVSFKDAQSALTSGDLKDLDNLLENAASKNGTTPEQISSIINEIFL